MRREITIGLVLMLVLSSLTIISGNVSAEIKKEDMTWSIGDKWEYRYTTVNPNQTTIFKMTAETTGESTVEIDGINYDVFVAELTGELETVDITSPFIASLVQGSTINGTSYVVRENDETTKTVQNLEYQLINETGKFLNFTQTIVSITRAISGGKPDVIDVETNWVSTIKTITTTTTTFSGSYFDYYQPGYTNTTTTTDTKTETFNCTCTGKENITTTAGTFETYEIRRTEVGEQGYLLQYLSSAVKGEVKDITYDHEGGTVISLLELISYDVATASSPTPKTPGFELAIVLCSIAIILLWKRKRMN